MIQQRFRRKNANGEDENSDSNGSSNNGTPNKKSSGSLHDKDLSQLATSLNSSLLSHLPSLGFLGEGPTVSVANIFPSFIDQHQATQLHSLGNA